MVKPPPNARSVTFTYNVRLERLTDACGTPVSRHPRRPQDALGLRLVLRPVERLEFGLGNELLHGLEQRVVWGAGQLVE